LRVAEILAGAVLAADPDSVAIRLDLRSPQQRVVVRGGDCRRAVADQGLADAFPADVVVEHALAEDGYAVWALLTCPAPTSGRGNAAGAVAGGRSSEGTVPSGAPEATPPTQQARATSTV
jgi:hypothetical protein